jgi:flagellar biosynthesis chaperone FliJ
MKIRIKDDNAYAIACMIKINVITFLNRLNHRIKNAIRKKKKWAKKMMKNNRWFYFKIKNMTNNNILNEIKSENYKNDKKRKWQEIK